MLAKRANILLLLLVGGGMLGVRQSLARHGEGQAGEKIAPASVAESPRAFAQAVVYLSNGYRLEVEAVTRLGPGLDPKNCSEFPVKKFGTTFSQGTTEAGSLETPANCVTARFAVPKERSTIAGSTGVLQCDSEAFYECVALLFDAKGVQVWGDNFKGQGFLTRPPSSVPFHGPVIGPLTLQVFTFTRGRTLPDRVD
ncbi:MAG TPA: hypothetical protein VG204_18910 [Terriglobia bacterium]|nr:hypothetical protein [Terriglobia bacterium]